MSLWLGWGELPESKGEKKSLGSLCGGSVYKDKNFPSNIPFFLRIMNVRKRMQVVDPKNKPFLLPFVQKFFHFVTGI